MKICYGCEKRDVLEDWHCSNCGWSPQEHNGLLSFAPELAEENDGFSPESFSHLAASESKHFWFRARNKLLIWSFKRYFSEARKFMEIGCGTGFVLTAMNKEFPDLDLTGSEIFNEGLKFTKMRIPEVSLYQMDARNLPFEDEFDVIGAFDVLEHIEEDEKVLSQIYHAIKPGGGIMITVPQHRNLWSILDEYSCHKRRYERKELIEKVERAGFRVAKVTSFVTFLLPVMYLSRLKTQYWDKKFNEVAEININTAVNASLEQILDMERALIKRDISLPIGGSLLLIGKKLQD